MVIAVYGASSPRIDKCYTDATENLCETLGKRGHSLVWGAGSAGVMGASARGFRKANAKIHGVIPRFFIDEGYEAICSDADELSVVETMAERKAIMENSCNAFVICPGGIGTFEEFFQTLTLKQLGRHDKAIVIFNVNGYYDHLLAFLEEAISKNFISQECRKLYKVCSSADETVSYIENYSGEHLDWDKLKIGKKN